MSIEEREAHSSSKASWVEPWGCASNKIEEKLQKWCWKAILQLVQMGRAGFESIGVHSFEEKRNRNFFKNEAGHLHTTRCWRSLRNACRVQYAGTFALDSTICHGCGGMRRRVQVGGANYGKLMFNFVLEKLNFNLFKRDAGHLRSKRSWHLMSTEYSLSTLIAQEGSRDRENGTEATERTLFLDCFLVSH